MSAQGFNRPIDYIFFAGGEILTLILHREYVQYQYWNKPKISVEDIDGMLYGGRENAPKCLDKVGNPIPALFEHARPADVVDMLNDFIHAIWTHYFIKLYHSENPVRMFDEILAKNSALFFAVRQKAPKHPQFASWMYGLLINGASPWRLGSYVKASDDDLQLFVINAMKGEYSNFGSVKFDVLLRELEHPSLWRPGQLIHNAVNNKMASHCGSRYVTGPDVRIWHERSVKMFVEEIKACAAARSAVSTFSMEEA